MSQAPTTQRFEALERVRCHFGEDIDLAHIDKSRSDSGDDIFRNLFPDVRPLFARARPFVAAPETPPLSIKILMPLPRDGKLGVGLRGLVVQEVSEATADYGWKVGDILVAINGVVLRAPEELPTLLRRLSTDFVNARHPLIFLVHRPFPLIPTPGCVAGADGLAAMPTKPIRLEDDVEPGVECPGETRPDRIDPMSATVHRMSKDEVEQLPTEQEDHEPSWFADFGC
eukprot:CAMPEP_0170215832 /NCGR_PEP_ID=MMETSP0116_2-20130129/7555_1 /TAXON_ID=400756 /ORGANISM="Durinskia baltica, Strain CSIRO CS-38" /LENGTH=227 /DNA_ID=CAMNT_0010466413 /DNA_START=28 /DNA_END=712 /DNA_ORIENTATION=-